MIKALIFDCFGVVVGRGFKRTYTIAGGDPEKDKKFIDDLLVKTNYGYLSRTEFDRLMAEKIGISQDVWNEAVIKSEQADEDMLDLIKSLRKKYKTALLSNASKGTLKNNFGPHNMEDYFDVLIASGEVGLIKPDPRIYQLSSQKLGVELDECLFIDDSRANVGGAIATGMQGIWYKNYYEFKKELENLLSS